MRPTSLMRNSENLETSFWKKYRKMDSSFIKQYTEKYVNTKTCPIVLISPKAITRNRLAPLGPSSRKGVNPKKNATENKTTDEVYKSVGFTNSLQKFGTISRQKLLFN